MEKNKLHIIAAILARSNMGQPRPEPHEIADLKTSRYSVTLDSAVTRLCEQYMESDEHYDIFMGEGQMFVDMLTEYGEEKSRASWPDIFDIYDQA